jgi:hypothetical protein
MEPEGSSPYTQQPATCPYPERDQSSLCPHTQPLEDFGLKHSVSATFFDYFVRLVLDYNFKGQSCNSGQ